jgi:hypothetical protein
MSSLHPHQSREDIHSLDSEKKYISLFHPLIHRVILIKICFNSVQQKLISTFDFITQTLY